MFRFDIRLQLAGVSTPAFFNTQPTSTLQVPDPKWLTGNPN